MSEAALYNKQQFPSRLQRLASRIVIFHSSADCEMFLSVISQPALMSGKLHENVERFLFVHDFYFFNKLFIRRFLRTDLLFFFSFSLQLMSKMVPLLGREITERLFLKRFAELCSSPMFYIRKICASSFGEYCAVVGRQAYETVLVSIQKYKIIYMYKNNQN